MEALEACFALALEANDAATRLHDHHAGGAELGRVAHDRVELVTLAGSLKQGNRAPCADRRSAHVAHAAADDRPSDFDDDRVGFAGVVRVEQEKRIPHAHPVDPSDVARRLRIERQISRL